jgi:hypothetical protein
MAAMTNPTQTQNAAAQDFLTAWASRYIDTIDGRARDWQTIEDAIELIQGTYDYVEHEAEKAAQAAAEVVIDRTAPVAEQASQVPEDVEHMIVLQAVDGLLENAVEDALTGGLGDRAADIAACQTFRDYYATAYDVSDVEPAP